jgi:hypothetical protein
VSFFTGKNHIRSEMLILVGLIITEETLPVDNSELISPIKENKKVKINYPLFVKRVSDNNMFERAKREDFKRSNA